jgi:hypothetical protein
VGNLYGFTQKYEVIMKDAFKILLAIVIAVLVFLSIRKRKNNNAARSTTRESQAPATDTAYMANKDKPADRPFLQLQDNFREVGILKRELNRLAGIPGSGVRRITVLDDVYDVETEDALYQATGRTTLASYAEYRAAIETIMDKYTVLKMGSGGGGKGGSTESGRITPYDSGSAGGYDSSGFDSGSNNAYDSSGFNMPGSGGSYDSYGVNSFSGGF